MLSEQLAKLFNGQPSIPHDSSHRDSIDRIVPRNGENAYPIGHHSMFPLPDNTKACLLQRPDGSLMIDSRQLRHNYTATSTSRTSASGVS